MPKTIFTNTKMFLSLHKAIPLPWRASVRFPSPQLEVNLQGETKYVYFNN